MIEYLEHHIVDHCNLNCAGCTHFSPLVKEPWFEDINNFIDDFKELARRTNVRIIRLMGGEPLLHPQVVDFLLAARNIFPNSEIELVTNGILLEKRKIELLAICNDKNISICTSDYGILNLRKALDGFANTKVHGKSYMYNASIDISGALKPNNSFNNCDIHQNHWYYFQDGRFFPCCISANIKYFKDYFNIELDEGSLDEISISVYNHSEEEIKEFLNKPIPLCKYCNTIIRKGSYEPFHRSKKEITEWIYQ